MSLYTANIYTPDGRLRGAYVYMLLCEFESAVLIKIGRSTSPLSRLNQLRTACPFPPKVICLAEVATIRKAAALERDLHHVLKKWHSHLEWFRVHPCEREEFNCAWKPALDRHSAPSRRIYWQNYSIAALMKQSRQRNGYRRAKFMRRGKCFQDFTKDSQRDR